MPSSIVICCDGTWNSADQEKKKVKVNGEEVEEICVTNVLKIACRLCKRTKNGEHQIVYYDQGVGTGNLADRIGGGAFGDGLTANINDTYRFLIANYEPGDRIYIFGFSRGAYTARSIAGMIRRCGILRRDAVRQYPEARALYASGTPATDPIAVKFREANAIEPETPIQCIGVWDTVGALGIPLRAFGSANQKKFQFMDTGLSHVVKFAFHALAVDEHRHPFLPTLWETKPDIDQTVQQVWFAGAHSDVGGGYPEQGLSDLALDWMMDAAKTAGLEVDAGVVAKLPTSPNPKQKVHNSKSAIYLFSGADRTVGGTKFGTEYFHKSIVERWRDGWADGTEKGEYRPKPLLPHTARLDALAKETLKDEIYPVS
ncbi:MAG: hypothetical protein QOF63_2458 [Thermoanaerobaculia bacterium]|jgi:uncharacterized protein (DUF2235 family)|nr:hypothetical protein [Thermoanaerobaculia bacterium]MEA2416483.1 hypothetical protein [Thermoanaerobaculia bacterium]